MLLRHSHVPSCGDYHYDARYSQTCLFDHIMTHAHVGGKKCARSKGMPVKAYVVDNDQSAGVRFAGVPDPNPAPTEALIGVEAFSLTGKAVLRVG